MQCFTNVSICSKQTSLLTNLNTLTQLSQMITHCFLVSLANLKRVDHTGVDHTESVLFKMTTVTIRTVSTAGQLNTFFTVFTKFWRRWKNYLQEIRSLAGKSITYSPLACSKHISRPSQKSRNPVGEIQLEEVRGVAWTGGRRPLRLSMAAVQLLLRDRRPRRAKILQRLKPNTRTWGLLAKKWFIEDHFLQYF